MGHTLALYLHPVAAMATVALAAYVASLGLGSRLPIRRAETVRRRHARLAPWVWSLVVANWVMGLATVWWLRPELEVATSGHFGVGAGIVALFTAAALVSRRIQNDPRARTVHPLLGAAALLLCGLQVFLGLQLLP
jgi:hypothetical protein